MAYAEGTKVPVVQTRQEIETTVTRFGAKAYMSWIAEERATIAFTAGDRNVRFDLPLPKPGTNKAKDEKELRRRWRALLLCIKAKLESVSSGIETFDEAFYSHVVMPNGRTIYEETREKIAAILKGGSGPLTLPDYSKKGG